MEFSSSTVDSAVVMWNPQNEISATNIKVAKDNVVKMCYFSTQQLPLNNRFEVVLNEDQIHSLISRFNAIVGRATNTADAGFLNYLSHNDINALVEDVLPFLNTAVEAKKNVIITIPIIDFEETRLEEEGMDSLKFVQFLAITDNTGHVSDPARYDMAVDKLCFGSILHVSETAYNSENVHLETRKEEFFFTIPNVKIFLNGIEQNSPCSICKLASQKLGDVCLYNTNNIECLFNCDKTILQKDQSDTPLNIKTAALSSIDVFEEVAGTLTTEEKIETYALGGHK